jgi:hypothetical protein
LRAEHKFKSAKEAKCTVEANRQQTVWRHCNTEPISGQDRDAEICTTDHHRRGIRTNYIEVEQQQRASDGQSTAAGNRVTGIINQSQLQKNDVKRKRNVSMISLNFIDSVQLVHEEMESNLRKKREKIVRERKEEISIKLTKHSQSQHSGSGRTKQSIVSNRLQRVDHRKRSD